jgi:hypothetical protein
MPPGYTVELYVLAIRGSPADLGEGYIPAAAADLRHSRMPGGAP